MASRRDFLIRPITALGAALFAVALPAADKPTTQAPLGNGSGLPDSFDLKKQLELGLKARRPSDFAYIERIVDKVNDGTLPRKLVDQAFLYARGRSKQYPIVYFQFTLKELTKKAGVPL
jgi:hypothetical protein